MDTRDSNKDAATQFRELGIDSFKQGDLEAAMRRLSKSHRLYPHSETAELLTQVQAAMLASKYGANTAEAASACAEEADRSSSGGKSGEAGTSTFRQRKGSASGSAGSFEAEAAASPEQVSLVKRIIRSSSNFYEVLEVTKTCTDEEIKKAYRKLSLKVHPDKNKAPQSDEAFKIVSRAFKCLSDSKLRSNYDTFGHEDPNQSRLQQQRERRQQAAGHHHAYHGNPFFQDDFDPNEIFNAFFGAHAMNGRVFVNRGGVPSRSRPQANRREDEEEGGVTLLNGLFRAMPVFFFLLFLLTPGSDPVYKLSASQKYQQEVKTSRLNLPYFVKSLDEFHKTHPKGSMNRRSLEHNIEVGYRESVEGYCYHERIKKAEMRRWRGQKEADKVAMPYCEELQRIHAAWGST